MLSIYADAFIFACHVDPHTKILYIIKYRHLKPFRKMRYKAA